MKVAPDLTWALERRRMPTLALLVLAFLVAGAISLQYWRLQLQARLEASERRLDQLEFLSVRVPNRDVAPRPELGAAGTRQVNEQIALLNRDWVGFLRNISPKSSRVKLLGMDVNPATGAIRIVGGTVSAEEANAYAERLQREGTALQDVRLVLVEQVEGKVKFEVTARWKD